MKRLVMIVILIGTVVAISEPVSAQRYRGWYGANYRPYAYAPRAAYWNGYYARPAYYAPYVQYYSYPSNYAWGYPRYNAYYNGYYRGYPGYNYRYGW